MSDADAEHLSGEVDPIGPWSIRSIRTATRDAAIAAARAEGISVGQWLDRRVTEWCQDTGSTVPSTAVAVRGSHASPAHSELRDLVQMARDLTPPDKDTQVMREARAIVRDRLKALRTGAESK